MTLLAVGLSHRTAPVRVLERAAVSGDEAGKLLDELLRCPNVSEAVLVATCNRVEVYAVVDAFHGGLADVSGVLARQAGTDVGQLSAHLYVHYAARAVEHLFRVASGLDSMVVGEAQVLGQLRTAYGEADKAGTVGKVLHELVQQALRVGKRVHSETGIDHAGASLVTEALADAAAVLGTLSGRRALIVGSGAMGGLAAAHLRRAGVAEIVVANRTPENGQRLAEIIAAEGVAARATGLSELDVELATADVVFACTGATEVVIDAGMLAGASRDIVLCDLGLPRDIDPAAAEVPGVRVVDLESLQARLSDAEAGADTRLATELVAEEVRAYLAAQRSAAVTPTVTALRRRAAEVVDAELLRLSTRLPELAPEVRDELSLTVRRVVDKLLHTPTVRVKQLASAPGGSDYADALRELFALDPQAPAAVGALDPFTHGVHSGQSEQDGDIR
ncbi:glutamyl-tRNA reductase [Allokutzneria sp. NRRL B-24872]|uniref:glutamyl-tRNA reductase n=1 Tax=Allokutzneria sp. NRRL B-24872 TaxID=1137961 RepID=UPI000A39784D|nr:glutamyl-tRNA reductase [Allokutzneria sp. NRRL B-24872]